jgi:DNA repair exonuclease SbcCD ATPase subunit
MAKPIPNPEPRSREDRFLRPPANPANGRDHIPEPPPNSALRSIWRETPAPQVAEPPGIDLAEVERLRMENEELKMKLEEMHQLLEEATSKNSGAVSSEREKEYESLLEEKSEIIRNLHLKIQELEQQAASHKPPPNEQELLALSDELERERCQLDQERRQVEEERKQLKEDEQTMMTQMREMEVQMARERAEMARQRNELQRLHSEIRHEIEVAQRDGLLNERLKTLQRKHQEVSNRKGAAPEPTSTGRSAVEDSETPAQQAQKPKDSGILRRFFGQK